MPKKTAAPAWPLGQYLRTQRGKMAIREASRRADISESRWRQVEAGVQRMAGGIEVPVHPRPETVVAMCKAIAADPRKGLELAGHSVDQYQWLLEDSPTLVDDPECSARFAALPRSEREAILTELQRVHVDAEVQQSRGGVVPPQRRGGPTT